MMHSNRIWQVTPVDSAEELANRLTNQSWTLCTGFKLRGFLFLNDATCEDGAQEYAVVEKRHNDNRDYRQVESITFSWCTEVDALGYINDKHDAVF